MLIRVQAIEKATERILEGEVKLDLSSTFLDKTVRLQEHDGEQILCVQVMLWSDIRLQITAEDLWFFLWRPSGSLFFLQYNTPQKKKGGKFAKSKWKMKAEIIHRTNREIAAMKVLDKGLEGQIRPG